MGQMMLPEMPAHGSAVSANWGRKVVDCLRRLQPIAGKGVTLKRLANGTVYDCTATGSLSAETTSEPQPFDVRWMPYDADGEDGEWQIYLPLGCVSVQSRGMRTLLPGICVNNAAKNADGEELPEWYHIDDPKTGDGVTTGNGNFVVSPVYALVKPWPRFMVSSDVDAYDTVQEAALVGSMLTGKANGEAAGAKTRIGRRTRDTLLQVSSNVSYDQGFDLVYKFASNSLYNARSKPSVIVTNLMINLGRTVVASDTECDVTDWTEVWLTIKHDVTEVKDMEISITNKASDSSEKGATSSLLLYRMEDNIVTFDGRGNMNKIRFYDP